MPTVIQNFTETLITSARISYAAINQFIPGDNFITADRISYAAVTRFYPGDVYLTTDSLSSVYIAGANKLVIINLFENFEFIDVQQTNIILNRNVSALTGVTEYVLWRNPYLFSNTITESYKTRSLLDYKFVISVSSQIELYSNVIFKLNNTIGKGRILSIQDGTYTIAPYVLGTPARENFYVVPKSQVALLPPQYR